MYKFEKINEDEYKLTGNGKEFTFTRTVDIVKEVQSIDLRATINVAEILAERGETYENTKLRITRNEGNKTIVDESNLRALESTARIQALNEVLDKVYRKIFNMAPLELVKEIGIDITDKESIAKFSENFTKILLNGMSDNTPRGEDA